MCRIRASASKRCARAGWRATTAASRSRWRSSVRTGAVWEVVEHDIRMAREFGLVSSSHTRRREECVVPDGYARMVKAGLLGPDHNLVHGTSYDDGGPQAS